jgi:segregation and condensation protein A
MTSTPAQRAIALLIDLAQQGKINPWDVQVIEVIDRFLSEIDLTGQTDFTRQKADLPQSGQAFLWASMLVLLKADTLEANENRGEAEEDIAIEGDFQEEENQPSLVRLHLEQHIRRRSCAVPPRRRRVTLQELIEQIQKMATEIEGEPSRSRYTANRSVSRREAARAIASLAHNENLTEVAAQLEKFLIFDWPVLAPEQTDVDLDRLLEWWSEVIENSESLSISSDESKTHDRVGVFWGLLLLSAQSKVELSQVEFYQDLKIRPLINVSN